MPNLVDHRNGDSKGAQGSDDRFQRQAHDIAIAALDAQNGIPATILNRIAAGLIVGNFSLAQ